VVLKNRTLLWESWIVSCETLVHTNIK
jgi:hypothetical protein